MIGSRITENKLFYFWYLCWFVICPVILVLLTGLTFKDSKPLEFKNYTFPYWTYVLGQLITASTASGVIFWAIYLVVDSLFIHKKPLISLIKPDVVNWKPLKEKHRKQMRVAHGFEEQDPSYGVDNLVNRIFFKLEVFPFIHSNLFKIFKGKEGLVKF